ncbi:hypothetical protein [uncultured Brevundimonas sp.]|uniref:hypothetical protein n=1 Tax=uncultured Brevundimonas sp. TaxID=213418 RepID=UPI0030ECB078
MTGLSVWRALTITGRIGLVAGLFLALVLAGRGLGLRWDPLNLGARRLEAVRTRAVAAEADAAARRLEREGETGQREALDRIHRQTDAVTRLTVPAILDARLDDDADLPLATRRARRLRAHDRELCRLAPAVCTGPAAADPAGGGDDAVFPGASG